jgi:hypothetical protein
MRQRSALWSDMVNIIREPAKISLTRPKPRIGGDDKELPRQLGITQRAYLAKSFRLSASRFAGLMMTMSKLIAVPVPAQVIEISCDAMMLCERESR